MAYSLYVSAVIGLQVWSAYMLLRVMEGPNLAFAGRLSLLTLSLCNIEDFSSTMEHIQYIMGSEVTLTTLRAATSTSSCPPSPTSYSSSSLT